MGYHTDFEGHFTLDKRLAEKHARYLTKFAETRRMKRNASFLLGGEDSVRTLVGLSIGVEGGYFVGGCGFFGQDRDVSVVDYNTPPAGQPGLWCHWVPTTDRMGIKWDESEKFYEYKEWLQYIVQHFLKPWGYTCSGSVTWQGEDESDKGILVVTDNVVLVPCKTHEDCRGTLALGVACARESMESE